MRLGQLRVVLVALLGVAAVGACLSSPARAEERVLACGASYGAGVFTGAAAADMVTTTQCPAPDFGEVGLYAGSSISGAHKGDAARQQATAPAGLLITGADAAPMSISGLNGSGAAYGGGFYWQGGGVELTTGQASDSVGGFASSYFGFQVICGETNCPVTPAGRVEINGIVLHVEETVAPTLAASGLWQAPGWVRGTWPLSVSGDSPAGVCLLAAALGGQTIGETTSASDPTAWHQCSAAPVSVPAVDTTKFADGPVRLDLLAADAAAQQAGTSKIISIDNQLPTVTLTGASNALSTAGTQYVTATAAAGPSGVAGISCSVDGAPAQWYAASTAQVAVSGVGEHEVQCFAENNAVDPNGVHGTSATGSFAMKIGTPTVAAIAFSTVVDKLRCHKVTERVLIPARWITVRVRGRAVRVREKAHRQTITLTRCHARTVRRRVTRRVTIRRHGKKVQVRRTRTVRVVLEPRTVYATRRRVGHGRGTIVDGWLGTSAGVALAGQTVQVLTAADNGRENFHVAAVTTTAANGGWSAQLPAGPSRLIEAQYPGAATTEPAISAAVHLIVPAKVQLLSVTPRHVAWGGEVRLTGRLRGGYLPPGGALVRLRIGEGRAVTTYGVQEHVTGTGRFTTTYRFGAGEAAVHRAYWFEIATLPMGDYPYAPANSAKRTVIAGGYP